MRKTQTMKPSLKNQRGATLIEALVAIVILALGMLGQAAFMLNAMRDSQQSRYRVIASYYAEEMISMAMTDTGNRAKYAVSASTCTETSWAPCTNWLTNLKRDLPQVSNAATPITVSIDNTSASANFGKIVVSVQWAAPDNTAQKFVATSNLNLIQ